MNDELSAKGCLGWIGVALVALVILVAVTFALDAAGIWEIQLFGVARQNAQTSVTRCSNQYLSTRQTAISVKLQAITNDQRQIDDPAYANQKADLQAQQLEDAYSVYQEVDVTTCNRQQLVDAMPQLYDFFLKWDSPTGHNYAQLVNPPPNWQPPASNP